MRVLVDTNVFLDLLLQRGELCKDAIEFFLWCKKNKHWTYVSSMSMRDIEYVVMKSLHDKKKANEVLFKVYSICTKIVGVSADDVINAMYEDYHDFEDELQIQVCREILADAIITNNKKDFENRGVPIFTPKEIVNL